MLYRVPRVSQRPGGGHFGLWRVRFPPVLVRTGRRLPVQALGERRVLVALTGYPRGGALDLRRGYATSCPPRQVNDSNLDFGVFAFLPFQ